MFDRVINIFLHRHSIHLGVHIFFYSLFCLIILVGVSYLYIREYDDRVLSGVHLVGYDISGFDRTELTNFIQDKTDKTLNEGWTFELDSVSSKEQFLISPTILTDGGAFDLATVDIDAEVERFISFGKSDNPFEKLAVFLEVMFTRPNFKIKNITIDRTRVLDLIDKKLVSYTKKTRNASIIIRSLEPLKYTITSSSLGVVYDVSGVTKQLTTDLSELRASYVKIDKRVESPEITEFHITSIIERIPAIFTDGDLNLSYTDSESTKTRHWAISKDNLRKWLTVGSTRDGGVQFTLNEISVIDFMKAVLEKEINTEARDAKFEVDGDGKVSSFQGSKPGKSLDTVETLIRINNAILTRMLHDEGGPRNVELAVVVTLPNVKTGEVNSLGIAEILGSGTSNFKGSPSNRIKNIRNAVNKLNGILIKPGEIFSAIKYTQPYTLEGGYLPELVIKGDELIPEIGGGLCQIGSTLFRMAMNSGLEIVERRNHSLVVNYYNDLTNGLPGTDATMYEPSPDFKFKNDTNSHILIQTSMNEVTGVLSFTLWGTNDGRKGWYEPPTVERWIKPGPTRIIYSDNLPPDERKCQPAFSGASAQFTYSRMLTGQDKEDRVFTSYYRPLPEICLVGKAKNIEEGIINSTDEIEIIDALPIETNFLFSE